MKLLTVNEKIKKYGREIIGVGIIYLILELLTIFMDRKELLGNAIAIIEHVSIILLLIFMIIGVFKKKKLGVVCGWILEIVFILASVLAFFVLHTRPDLVGVIVIICLPFELIGFYKALKEMDDTKDENGNEINSNKIKPIGPLTVAILVVVLIYLIISFTYMATFLNESYL